MCKRQPEGVEIKITWLPPLFTNAGGYTVIVGLADDGIWYIDPNEPSIIGDGKTGLAMLPLMQPGYGGPLSEVKLKLSQLASECDQSIDLSAFPYHAPVETALDGMYGWLQYVDTWLPCITLNQEKAQKYFELAQGKLLSQKSRQKLLNQINQWTRANGYCLIKAKNT